MENNIIPAASRELQAANAEQISGMTSDVLDLDKGLRENNNELRLLNDAIGSLTETLEVNNRLKTIVRKSMQKVITKL